MRKLYVFAILIYVVIYLLPLGVRPLITPDESRYAEIPREMIISGDWVVPRLDGLLYFEKPILGYWLNAVSMRLLGQNRFAVRLPSALAAGLTVLLLFALVKRHDVHAERAASSAGILLTSALFYGIGTFAVLDMPLTLFLTGAMVCFFFAYQTRGISRRGFEALSGVFCGLAFLTKGFLALAVPAVAILPFLLWEKRWRDILTMVWIPLFCAALVALPWSILIHTREPDFWHFFFWHEHVKRFMSSHPQHPQPFWYFLPVLLGCLFPWTLVLPAAVAGLKRRALFRHDALLRYCLCWFLFPFLLFSISRGKLATYILPCFPPLALLMASGLSTYVSSTRRKLFDGGLYLGAGIFATIPILLIVHQAAGLHLLPFYGGGGQSRWILLALALLGWAAALLAAGRSSKVRQKLLYLSLGPVLLMGVAGFAFPEEAKNGKAPEDFLQRHADRLTPQTTIIVGGDVVRAVCWVCKRKDVFVTARYGELEYGLKQPEAKGRFLSFSQFGDMVRELAPGQRAVFIAEEGHYHRWEDKLPQPSLLDIDQGFAFAEYLGE